MIVKIKGRIAQITGYYLEAPSGEYVRAKDLAKIVKKEYIIANEDIKRN